MKTSIDTNLLIRYLTCDDKQQTAKAVAVIESGHVIFIATIVLCEAVYVLQRAYHISSDQIAVTLQRIIESRNVELDRPAAEYGLAMLRQGGDFADGVVLYESSRAKCDRIVTFDQTFERLLGGTDQTPHPQPA